LHAGKIAETPHELAPGDCSVQVHAAPGHARQIEVLRDVLLGLLRDNPDLTESDIAVVCPQLDAYGPVLGAVLGASAERNDQPVAGRVPALRYTVVDKSARSFNPILDAMAQILDLLPGRFDVVSVRSVLAAPAIRQRFGLTGDDLSLVGTLAEDAGVRWGIDGPHRAKWDITPDHRANSWVAGLDQLMMGVALGDSLRDAVPPGSTSAEYPSDHFDLAVGGIAVMPLGDGDMSGAGRLSAAV
jgi:exodeoxyribonuclease V gamma subunit